MFNITNYNEHPTRKTYTVFHFYHKERADSFEELLIKEQIWFESEIDEQPEKIVYFFGVRNNDLKKVERINYVVSAIHRKPIIPSKMGRWALYTLSILLLILIILGYINNAKT